MKYNTLWRTAPSVAVDPCITLNYMVVFPEPVVTSPAPLNQHKFSQHYQGHHSSLLADLEKTGPQSAGHSLVCALSSNSWINPIVTSTYVPVFMEALVISGAAELQSQEVSL